MSTESTPGLNADASRHPANSPHGDSVFGDDAVERLSDDLTIPTQPPTLDGLPSPLGGEDVDPITGAPRTIRAPRQEAVAAPYQPFASDSAFSSSSALSALSTASSLSAPSPSEAADFSLSDDAWRSPSEERAEVPSATPEAVEDEADAAAEHAAGSDAAPNGLDTDHAGAAVAHADETTHEAADVVGHEAVGTDATHVDQAALDANALPAADSAPNAAASQAAEAAPQRRVSRRAEPRDDLHSTQERRMAFFQEQIITEGNPTEPAGESFMEALAAERAAAENDAAAAERAEAGDRADTNGAAVDAATSGDVHAASGDSASAGRTAADANGARSGAAHGAAEANRPASASGLGAGDSTTSSDGTDSSADARSAAGSTARSATSSASVNPADAVAVASPYPSAASASSASRTLSSMLAPSAASAASAGASASASAATTTSAAGTANSAAAASTSASRAGSASSSTANSATEPTPVSTEGDVLLDGSTVVGKPASRAGAHWASLLLTLVFAPIAWFFLSDATRELIATHEPFSLGVNMRGLLFLGAGLLALIITMSLARRSSLGAWAAGIVTLAVGITPLAAPTIVENALTPFLSTLSAQSSLGAVIAEALWTDAITGRLATYGVVLILLAVVSHSARRAGRREQEVIDRIRKSAR